MTDIRTSRRFPVQLPLKVLGGPNVPVGTTANISAAGVYLWIDGGLELGSSIDFEVTIPQETIGGDDDAHLHCHGRVLRCDAGREARTHRRRLRHRTLRVFAHCRGRRRIDDAEDYSR